MKNLFLKVLYYEHSVVKNEPKKTVLTDPFITGNDLTDVKQKNKIKLCLSYYRQRDHAGDTVDMA